MPHALKDPQSWISLIGVVTVIGLCAGLFEPANAPPSITQVEATQPPVVAQQAGGELLALNGR